MLIGKWVTVNFKHCLKFYLVCAQETSSTDDENKKICSENGDVSEVDSEQAISRSQKEREDTQGEGKRGSSEHEGDTSHSNNQGTDDSNSDAVSEDELKLPGNL